MSGLIKIAFASGTDDLNQQLVARMRELYPDLPLYIVSEFPLREGKWVPYHVCRGFFENFWRCRAAIRGKRIRLAGVLLVPRVPYRRMRLIALLLSPTGFLAFNENLGSFMLRPRCVGTIIRHLLWRVRNFLRWQLHPGGSVYTFFWRLSHPHALRLPMLYRLALLNGRVAVFMRTLPRRSVAPVQPPVDLPPGISVVIPSRNGRELLAQLLPGLLNQLQPIPSEVIVVDNGSDDGSGDWLARNYPQVAPEHSAQPLSFARAVNLGIRRARYSHVMLLNNDMVLEPDFFPPLVRAFAEVPDLFCATAQIFFPAGIRREETGKSVMAQEQPADFPLRCDLPIPGEDLSYVLYGSGGCSLYCARKLKALGLLSEIYQPAYVEDLDLGYRAWQRGWPSVFVSQARLEHRHRATTSRYFAPDQITNMLEINYLRFLSCAVVAPAVFRRLWRQAVYRLRLMAADRALQAAATMPVARPVRAVQSEELILALGSGDVAVFRGTSWQPRNTILIASPYLPFPLSHGGAVRMYNLMRRAAADFGQVLVAFCDRLETPPAQLLEICREIVLVRRMGSHSRPTTTRPDMVEEFDSLAFHAALRQTARKWKPRIAQLEFTQMAQYARDSAPAKTILVEHDITFDLYGQLLRETDDWEIRRQWRRWCSFETRAWRQVDRVVAMSERDRRAMAGARAVCLPNAVDLERFRPSSQEPEPRRLLFVGSFAHLPNLMAVEYFLSRVWPLLEKAAPVLHIIAGARHEDFLDHYQDRVRVRLDWPRVHVEGFVSDVRPAYTRAAMVLAPLVASAGTNIKILEAMAMGKAIVSTPAGVNGLDISPGQDVLVTETPAEMAAAILSLIDNPAQRRQLELQARQTVVRQYDWDRVALQQKLLYEDLLKPQT